MAIPQVPLRRTRNPTLPHLGQLEEWLRSYRPQELFDETGRLQPQLAALAAERGAPHERQPARNGGVLLTISICPTSAGTPPKSSSPGTPWRATRVLGRFAPRRDGRQPDAANFRVFGPDETASNRLDALFEVTGRTWMADSYAGDDEWLTPKVGSPRSSSSVSARACQGVPADRPARPRDPAEAAHGLAWLGVTIDDDANQATNEGDRDISLINSPVRTLVVHAREDLQIARECRQVMASQDRGEV